MSNIEVDDELTTPGSETTMQSQVYRWAYRFLNNHHDALDATQEVLLKWLRARSQGIESRTAWLRRITVNHCIDLIRQRQRRRQAESAPDTGTLPADPLAEQELRDSIAAALARLSEHQRAVLVAKIYDSETFAAIAESMGLSVSSVKTHYLRGLEAMRDALRGVDVQWRKAGRGGV